MNVVFVINSMLDNKLWKSSGDPQKSSKIFVNLRRSSGQSIREQSDRWPLFLVFKGVPGCIEGILGYFGMLRGVSGCSGGVSGCSGVFRGCSGVFQVCSVVFRGVLGCSEVFRVLQTPHSKSLISAKTFLRLWRLNGRVRASNSGFSRFSRRINLVKHIINSLQGPQVQEVPLSICTAWWCNGNFSTRQEVTQRYVVNELPAWGWVAGADL